MSLYQQTIHLSFNYPVVFTDDVFSIQNPVLSQVLDAAASEACKALVFIDDGLLACRKNLPQQIQARFATLPNLTLSAPPTPVPGGEAIKTDYRLIMKIVDMILEYELCRHSFVIVIGGGAVLDAIGFAASIVHRGLRVVRLPTTVLAQNDAGIGVKTGMNLHGVKNAVGTFQAPFAVVNDYQFLCTLPDIYWRGGIAEAIKVALIKDISFFEFIEQQAESLRTRDLEVMKVLVQRCAKLHLQHIRSGGDPFETGSSRPLDFGHWAAHRLEAMSRYRVSHGEAVAVGMALDLYYASRQNWISAVDFQRCCRTLLNCGLALWQPELAELDAEGKPAILGGLDEFRAHLGGPLCLTFPQPLGARIEVHEVDRELMTEAVRFLHTTYKPVNLAK